MSSSDMRSLILGDTHMYERLLKAESKRISKRYNDPDLKRHFDGMVTRFVSLGPMALFDSIASDIGIKPDRMLMASIGLASFHISTHDDIVDETPANKDEIASLLYSGNISFIEGVAGILRYGNRDVLNAVMHSIKTNHHMQQRVVKILWSRRRPTEADYFEGIRHIISWTSIGPNAALALSGTHNYSASIGEFCKNYGTAIQLLDDMSEIDEDLKNGYWSLPIILASRKSIDIKRNIRFRREAVDMMRELAEERLAKASSSIPKGWNRMQEKVSMLNNYISGYKT